MRREVMLIYKQFFSDTYSKNMMLNDIAVDITLHKINVDGAYDMLYDFLDRFGDLDASSLMFKLERWLIIINDKYVEFTMPNLHGFPTKGPSYTYLYDLVVEFLDYLSEISFWQLIHSPDPTVKMK